ncbi:MAG: hypothetical protein Q4D79_07745, partial [Propionibacteriaceae bacterium]|nr:hypothetical protein [Propionibacteriaceae bacterium]
RIAVPLLAVAALAGCSPSSSTAAVVDGRAISEQELTTAFDACREFGDGISRNETLFYLVTGRIVDIVGEQAGMPVDEAMFTSQLAQNPQAAPILGTACEPVLLGNAKLLYLQRQMDPVAVATVTPNIDVTFNPRYGSWDWQVGLIPEGGSISVPEGGARS